MCLRFLTIVALMQVWNLEQICSRASGNGTEFSMPSHGRSVICEVTGSEVSNKEGIGNNVLLSDGDRKLQITIGDSAGRI